MNSKLKSRMKSRRSRNRSWSSFKI